MWPWTSQTSLSTPGRSGTNSRDPPGAIDWLNPSPPEITWTLCVSASSFVNRKVRPRVITWTLGTNCSPRWRISATSATPAASPTFSFGPAPSARSRETTAGLISGEQSSGSSTRPETSAPLAVESPRTTSPTAISPRLMGTAAMS